ncbi:TonB-dependent receptor domain-containing protein [Chromobacterium violaceum]|uniref:TonB-dependent receptor domain-containing protein n=1 Tax=Chromobacterium violaceum TaxID=536 RepID=UPI0015F82F60|nr:TonB-dependent receptor [Chromobacterium violaceum]MBA8733853.1 TonB-dependent receptor [Chromobacterium violaceum]
MFKLQTCAALTALACSGLALADGVPQFVGDPVIVTASRIAQPLSKTLADATVITRDEIEESGAQTLQQVLSRQAAVSITTNGGPGTSSSIFMRGANSNHTVVLVDGMRISSATTGTTAIQSIPLEQIERIEILRGPASSLYGADAIGGVIQIFTRTGEGAPRFNAGFEAGSRGTGKLTAGIDGKTGDTAYSLQLSHAQSDGFSATNPRNQTYYNPDNDGYGNDSYTASVNQTLAPGHDLTLRLYQTFAMNDWDRSNKWTGQDRAKSRLTGQSIESKNQFSDVWTSRLRFSKTQDKLENFYNGNFDVRADLYQTTQEEWLWQNDLNTTVGNIILGISHGTQKIESSDVYSETKRSQDAGFATYQFDQGAHLFQASLRRDHDDQFGGKTTGKFDYGYKFAEGWMARVGYGAAYKAPTFNDLYYPYSGNPSLKPEDSKNTELSLQYRKGQQSFSVTIFQNKINQLINWAPAAPDSEIWVPKNIDRATIRGLTLEGATVVAGVDLGANLTLLDARDDGTGHWLERRPRQSANFTASKELGKWTLGAEQQIVSRRYDDPANTEAKALHGYGVTNAFANYRFARNWTATARVDNLFDREYETAYGYNTGGLGAFIGVRYSQ